MKKIYIIVVIMISLLVSSCHSELEVIPQTSSTEKDRERLQEDNPDLLLSAGMNSMYRYMVNGASAGDQYTVAQNGVDFLLSLLGNDVPFAFAGRFAWFDYTIDYRSEIYVRSGFFWNFFYKTITNSNNLLKILPEEGTPHTLLDNITRATALTFRGYAYFYLANIYQLPYSDANKSLPGVPIVIETTVGDQPRSTLEETYTQAISDLVAAQNIFIETGQVKRKPTEHDATTCAIYLARAYLAIGDFVNAEKQADIVIANYRVLQGRDELWDGFCNINQPNVVFGFENSIPTRLGHNSKWSHIDPYVLAYTISNVKYAFNGILDKIGIDDDRFFWWLSPEATEALVGPGKGHLLRDTGYQVNDGISQPHQDTRQIIKYISVKFIGTGRDFIISDPTLNGKRGTRDWDLGDNIYLRSEEAYLNKAEALAHQGRLGEAKTALESFVKTRNATYTCPVSAKDDLITEIQLHKRIEFWLEGIEHLDNRRLNVPVDRRDKPELGFVSNHHSLGKLYITQDNPQLIYQLPNTEMNSNTALDPSDQNP